MNTSPLPATVLWKVARRHLLHHGWQSLLMIIGITLGVAVVIAIDLANASASRAFDLSTEAVAGRATHQITGGPSGLDEKVYVMLRRQGLVHKAAPILLRYVSSPQLGNIPLQLMGIDPFAEAPFRSYLTTDEGDVPLSGLAEFLTQPNALLLSRTLAERFGLSTGDHITLEIGGRPQQAVIVGLLHPDDSLSRRGLENLLLADIATAQELTGQIGRLDHIDLILDEANGEEAQRIQRALPEGVRLQTRDARSGTVKEMVSAFRLNLTALSLLALVVGMFLIYNTMTFSVVQRRALFGTLRCLGVTRREVFLLVVGEALIIGLLASGLGIGVGILLAQSIVGMVTQTINDLYFVANVRSVEIASTSLLKGILLGLLATVISAALPAWEAASVPPRAAMSRSGLESKARRAVKWSAPAGVLLASLGALILNLPNGSLSVSFAGTFAVVVGFAMLTPLATILFMGLASRVTRLLWGALGQMAPRSVVSSLSRTSIAVAALMVAVSVTIGVGLMVGSFRHTVVIWLEQTLQGDIYITAPNLTASPAPTSIEPALIQRIEEWPGVVRVNRLRSAQVDSPYGPIHVAAVDDEDFGSERLYLAADGPPREVWQAVQRGAVIVTEPLANRLGLPQQGGEITLYTDAGEQTFPVVGIYYDYASSQGTVMMALPTYRHHWDDEGVTSLSLTLADGVDAEAIVTEMQTALLSEQRLLIRANRTLREEVMIIFDRTFAITRAVQALATIVAFIGVLSALLALQLERQRERGILRAIGLTVRQLWSLVMLETGLMGAVAGLLAIPTGFALSLILIYIINRRAFGWTLQMALTPETFVQAWLVAICAALLAGLYPAYRMGQTLTADALRSE